MLLSLSPLDGRYEITTTPLRGYFSEFALIKYRVYIEIEYLKALMNIALPGLKDMQCETNLHILNSIVENFDEAAAAQIKTIEKI